MYTCMCGISLLQSVFLFLDKYGTAYGAGGQSQMYVYHHEEDESTFRLVDTSKPQRPMHQKPRGRQMQVRQGFPEEARKNKELQGLLYD